MGRRWNREEFGYFYQVRDERLHAVYEASRILQAAADIEPGTKTVGRTFGRLWELPQLPPETPVKRKRGIDLPATNAVEGGAKAREMSKRKQHQSCEPNGAQAPHVDVPRIVIESPTNAPLRQPLKPFSSSRLPPASPPPNWWEDPLVTQRSPAYWIPWLSAQVNQWLGEPTTKSSQISLSHLELRSVRDHGHPQNYISINERHYTKVKLTQLSIATTAAYHSLPEQSLDWIVLQVDHKVSTRLNPHAAYTFPYWTLAFPWDAVTDYKVIKRRPAPASPTPPRPHNPSAAKGNPQGTPRTQTRQRAVYKTTLGLETKGKAPLLHGRGIQDKAFLKDFVEACMRGRAVIELDSVQPLLWN